MKTLSIFILLSFGVFLGTIAQEKNYAPNARQAVQKSRMQQPQYMEVTQPEVEKAKVRKEQPKETVRAVRTVNYQLERPMAIDAPKRRGKKSAYRKLASNKK